MRSFDDIAGHWKDFLAKISYKPGWTFWSTISLYHETISIYVSWKTKDVSCPSSEIELTAAYTINMTQMETMRVMNGEQSFVAYMTWFITERIRWVEMHEMDEWLKVDGIRLRDPHPELARQRERELEKEACSKI